MACTGARLLVAACCAVAMACAPAAEQASQPSLAAASAPPSKALPLKRDAPGVAGGTAWAGGGVLLLVLAVATVLVLRRRGLPGLLAAWPTTASRGGAVVRLSSQALTPQASVHAVRWQGEDLLLGCSGQQVTVLARRPSPAAGDAP